MPTKRAALLSDIRCEFRRKMNLPIYERNILADELLNWMAEQVSKSIEWHRIRPRMMTPRERKDWAFNQRAKRSSEIEHIVDFTIRKISQLAAKAEIDERRALEQEYREESKCLKTSRQLLKKLRSLCNPRPEASPSLREALRQAGTLLD